MTRILAVGAHPDDIELQCAGTLAKFAARGDQVFMAISTNGELGSAKLSRAEIARVREQEARASAGVIGAELIWLGYPDGFLIDNEATRLRYIDLIRQTRPDMIITHDPVNDYHPDHNLTGLILWNVRVNAAATGIQSEFPPHEKIPEYWFMDTLTGQYFQPQTYVDITDTMDKKRAMLGRHESQMEFMKQRYGMTIIEFMELCSGFRGLQAQVRYAEAFRHSMTFPATYTQPLL